MKSGDTDVVVITGATSGIGRATARQFGEDGARVGLLARGEDGLDATKGTSRTRAASGWLACRCSEEKSSYETVLRPLS